MQSHFYSSGSLGAAYTRKISISLVLITAAVPGVEAAVAPAPCAVTAATEAQLRTALTSTCNTAAGGTITLAADITATTGRFEYPGSGNGNLTLNGMGHTLSVTTGANFGVLSAGGTGAFTVDQTVITGGNASGRGGGIEAGNLIVSNSVINNNQAQDSGGGIAANNVTVTGSTISGNSSQSGNNGGGGIYASDSVTIDSSTISGNSTPSDGMGGGIFGGRVTLTASTVSGNASNSGAGGINAYTLTAINSTIANNNPVANDGTAGAFYAGEATLIFTTVAGNGSTQMIVGSFDDPMPLTMIGSLVTNPIPFGGNSKNCQAAAAHSNESIEGNRQGEWTCGLNLRVMDVGLGPLRNNGGPTETMMPTNNYFSSGDEMGTGVTIDQRGAPRPRSNPLGGYTLGSVQYGAQPPYAFQGFLYPLKSKGWNRIAAGQQVKLSWRLRDGATGRLVNDPKTKTWASYVPVDCRSGDAAPAEISRAAVGSQVQWRKGKRQFAFHWQAPDLAGRCVRLDLSLADGSNHQAFFRIKGRRTGS